MDSTLVDPSFLEDITRSGQHGQYSGRPIIFLENITGCKILASSTHIALNGTNIDVPTNINGIQSSSRYTTMATDRRKRTTHR